MLTKIDYLKRCITNLKIIESKKWYISCFAIPLLKEEQYDVTKKSQLDIVIKLDGLYYLDFNEENVLVPNKILDYVKDQPLFNFQDLITVDNTWLPSISGKIETKIGNLVVNTLCIYPSLKNKIEYINKPIKINEIEKIFVQRVKNDSEAKDNDILVSEMIDCIDRLNFLTTLATLINVATTPKVITKSPDTDAYREKLLKEYEGLLSDPVKLVELENKLSALDNEYLKDDPVAKNVFSKKSKTARKKMYLIYGDGLDFENSKDNKTITSSLSDGIDTSEEEFPKYMNDLRSASFNRGSSTALSGYSYKILQRSLSGIKISKTPCDTTKGLKRYITEKNYSKLVNRYIKDKNWILVANIEQAKKYINKEVEIRSSMYCTSPGNTICYACMSDIYKDIPNGVTNIAANISSVLMTLFLKKMHGTITETTDIKIEDLVT